MLNVDFSILNQKGTPAFFADALANRPAAGFVGRIFVDTNNPSTGMYRDTGTAWVNVTGGGAETQTLQNVCDLGNTCTTPVRFGNVNLAPSTSYPLACSAQNFFSAIAPASVKSAFLGVAENIFNVVPAIPTGFAYAGLIGSWQTTLQGVNITIPNGVSSWGGVYGTNAYQLGANNITQTQAGGIRTLSGLKAFHSFALGDTGSVSHIASIWGQGLYAPAATPVVTNYYGLLLSNATEVYLGSVTNRWGVYQEGVADNNYFAGAVTIGQPTLVTGVELNVEGGAIRGVGAGTTSATRGLQILNQTGTTGLVVLDNGNVGIRESAPSARLHIATGGATSAAIGLKVRNSADTIDILKTYGTTQVQIASTASLLENSAQLQVDSIDRGFLPPRMTNAQILAIAIPAEGLLVYNTTINHLCCYQAGAWVKFSHTPM